MPRPSETAAVKRSFPIYDNMSYIGKPDTKKYGLIPSNIIDEGRIWPPGHNYGVLPNRGSFDAIVAANMANPGPIVLDIEKLPLKGSPGTIRQHLQVLQTLADWTRADAPGKTVGHYGYNTLTGRPTRSPQFTACAKYLRWSRSPVKRPRLASGSRGAHSATVLGFF